MTNEGSAYLNVLMQHQAELRNDIETIKGIIGHSSEQGSEIEEAFRRALRKVLPSRFGITTGFVVDHKGKMSKQLDIILFDALNTSPIFSGQGRLIIPAECTYAAGEVKSKLGKKEIIECFDKCRSYKSLDRSAHIIPIDPHVRKINLYGTQHDYWPPLFFVLAWETDSQHTFDKNIEGARNRQENHSDVARIDTMITLKERPNILDDRGMVSLVKVFVTSDANGNIYNVNLCQEKGQDWLTYQATKPWALFVSLLNSVITQAPLSQVNMQNYLRNCVY